jgi:heme/copper-type cytochrome/quinol oxidase subunit 4
MADDSEEHLTTTEAREGATPHMTRYVLGFGLALVIIIFAIIFWAG